MEDFLAFVHGSLDKVVGGGAIKPRGRFYLRPRTAKKAFRRIVRFIKNQPLQLKMIPSKMDSSDQTISFILLIN
ncbi:MAG: hypothetical protein A2512_10820 [Deltaproteobacteria bacterium RIFOXYD12_FULL_56_24]|nr:MAG: hypothetical protein A2512_10820 [Deltaproteobacteria bacterium RIFOXYD12_FULL_56_24]